MNETIQENASLQKVLEHQINLYLAEMKGQNITNLHSMVIEQIEPALFQTVIEHCKYNQLRAARVMGVSRGTLRTKLKKYFGDKYCGTRES